MRSQSSPAVVFIGLVLAVVSISGCVASDAQETGASEADAATGDDAGIAEDAGDVLDAGPVVSDAWVAPEVDAGVDGGLDASVDCGPCVASGPCLRSACVDGRCVESAITDGTVCDEIGLSVCVAGLCVARGCGDGWVEPGPSPEAERCDDGNGADADGCDATCHLTPVIVDADPLDQYISVPTSGARVIGVDGAGRVLFVWIRDAIDHEELHAAIVGPFGAPTAIAPLVLEPKLLTPSHADPTVVGLRDGGFIVAWSAIRGRSRDIVFVRISSDGIADPEVIANRQRAGDQLSPSLARVGDGFALAWTSDYETSADPMGSVYGRVFGPTGIGLTNELALASDRAGLEGAVVLDGSPNGFVATFTQGRSANQLRPSVRARRFASSGAADGDDFVLTGLDADQPSVACRPDGFCAVVYRDRTIDPAGDVRMQWIPPVGSPDGTVSTVVETASHAEQRPVVAPTPTGGWLVAWEDAPPGRVAYRLLPNEAIGPEATVLTDLLDVRAYGDVSLTPTPRGIWFALSAQAAGRFLESFTAFFLPLSHSP